MTSRLAERFKKFANSGANNRPPLESFYIYILTTMIGFMAADLTILNLRPMMIPTENMATSGSKQKFTKKAPTVNRETITSRNIFNPDGVIPDPLNKSKDGEGTDDGEPVLTQLPLDLIGTIVHANPDKSLATMNLRSQGKIVTVRINEDMEGMGTLLKVNRMRAVFRNANNGRLEYVELKQDLKLSFAGRSKTPVAQTRGDIRRSGNKFTLSRRTVNDYLARIEDIVMDAKAVPFSRPGSGGKIEGFKIISVKPGSIFDKLGIERMDVLKSVNGEKVSSPAKAMELFNALKESDSIKLELDRNGQNVEFDYSINN